jgi:hypothetical protein
MPFDAKFVRHSTYKHINKYMFTYIILIYTTHNAYIRIHTHINKYINTHIWLHIFIRT